MTKGLFTRTLVGVVGAAVFVFAGCGTGHVKTSRRVVVLGVDGLDYQLVRDLMARGRMPHFTRLAKSGGFSALATSIPPQSPVAWSTFITGLDPGQHGIFDFIHRDPKTMAPFLSTSRTEAGGRKITLGRWQFPLQAGRVELLRRGQPFWDVLERHGIETTIIRMPADFPPSRTATRELSGMGTPDLLGTYGTFSFFTSQPSAFEGKTVSGGIVVPVDLAGGVVRAAIEGPDNPYSIDPLKTRVEFTAYLDRTGHYAKLVVSGEERLLRVGEWTDWVPVELKLQPFGTLAGECRFYLKQLEPSFELYASPINIDPLKPVLPISNPPSYASELARATGRFYTQGMPEDTKGLKTSVLSADEFLEQARIAGDENIRQYWYVLDRFAQGFLFYYFGNVDQVSHMMWRPMDPAHPAYTADDVRYQSVVEDLYVRFDQIVGETMSRLQPTDLLVIMSDHGFASWRRSFSLNSWLRDHGYLVVRDPKLSADPGLFTNVDWTRTRAYALGLNGLYVNVRGREAHGIVDPAERQMVGSEIARRLEETMDPQTGMRAISRVFRREDVYRLRADDDIAPDLIVGYAKGTRSSDESALGAVPQDTFIDNTGAWNGDHCMDPSAVPGILLTSRPLQKTATSLQTLAAALAAEFGIDRFPDHREEK
jgi:predicted AlkP superfamily phosphohydrolase/phosphomutase